MFTNYLLTNCGPIGPIPPSLHGFSSQRAGLHHKDALLFSRQEVDGILDSWAIGRSDDKTWFGGKFRHFLNGIFT